MTADSEQNSLFAPTAEGGLLIGARGWSHASWSGGFYPPDLPEEWRLGYYANEFSTVLVPADRWTTAEPALLEEWAEEVHAGFRFVLESTGEPTAGVAAALGERFGGRLAPDALWRPGYTGRAVRAALLPAGPHSPRALRERVEAFAEQAPAGERFLFLEGRPPEIETLRTLVTLRDLMGL